MGTEKSTANHRMFVKVFALISAIPGYAEEVRNGKAVQAATLYMLACERAGLHHHPEDGPLSCFTDVEETKAMQLAWEAMWKVIGEAKTKNEGYKAAWEVWGVLLPEVMGTENAESTL